MAGRHQDDVWEMSEESAPGKPWKKKFLAWWEGYDLPKDKAEQAAGDLETFTREAASPTRPEGPSPTVTSSARTPPRSGKGR